MKLWASVPIGVEANVEFDRIIVSGKIRYCEPAEDGMFQAGLQIQSVFDRA
jgi:hypothetical protein